VRGEMDVEDGGHSDMEWNFASRVITPPKFCRIYSGKKKVKKF
jgi:hypothetical protein